MFKKAGKAITDYAQKQGEKAERQIEIVEGIFEEHIENTDDYIMGVVQTERDTKGVAATASRILLDSIMIDYTDYVAAVNLNEGTLVLLRVENEAMASKHVFNKGEYKIKKESKLIDKIFGKYLPRRSDRYNRDRFVLKSNNKDKFRLLVGHYITQASDYPYDNEQILKALTSLVKQSS